MKKKIYRLRNLLSFLLVGGLILSSSNCMDKANRSKWHLVTEKKEKTKHQKSVKRGKDKSKTVYYSVVASPIAIIGGAFATYKYFRSPKKEIIKEETETELKPKTQDEIDANFLTLLKSGGEKKELKEIYSKISDKAKLDGIEWAVSQQKGSLITIFDQDSTKEKCFENLIKNKKVSSVVWIMSKLEFAQSTKVEMLHLALEKGYSVFLEKFDKDIKSKLILKYRKSKSTKLCTKKDYQNAIDYREEEKKRKAEIKFTCIICAKLISDPVKTKYECYYCRDCITTWLNDNQTCPNTRQPLTINDILPVGRFYRNELQEFKNNYPDESD